MGNKNKRVGINEPSDEGAVNTSDSKEAPPVSPVAPVAPRPAKLPPKQRLREFFLWLLFRWHLVWLSVCHASINFFATLQRARMLKADERRFKKRKMKMMFPLQRKLVIAGDDIALGVGDSVTLSNVQPAGILRSLPVPMTGLFFGWHYFSYGKIGSSSEDWLPAPENKMEALASTKWKSVPLFEQAFHPKVGLHADTDVVVLCLGFCDRFSADTTAKNVVRICAELEARGKTVLVVPPFMTDHISKLDAAHKTRFEARIQAICESVKRVWPEQKLATTKVKLGMELSSTMKHQNSWSFGGRYPGSKGYRGWAHMYREFLFNVMKSAEAPLYLKLLGS